MLVSGETSANQPRKLSGLWPGRQFLFELGIGRSPERLRRALRLIPEAFLVPIRFHALAALMLGNFRFASFLKRAHSDFQIREC
jgi:hypothetical protein